MSHSSFRKNPHQGGFTLAEVLVALAITGIVTGAVFGLYLANARTYEVQNQVIDLQQNLRNGIDVLRRELKMAGYDPQGIGGYGIVTAGPEEIQFTLDENGDGDATHTVNKDDGTTEIVEDVNEYQTFSIYTSGGKKALGRKSTSSGYNSPLAENIEALGFAYAFDADGDGMLDNAAGRIFWALPRDAGGTDHWFDLDTNGDGDIDEDDGTSGTITGVDTGITTDLADVRAVRVWLLGRTDRPDREFLNSQTYTIGRQIKVFNDHYRRRLLATTVQCRNLGL
ncbi:hypothetical protein DESUT3_03830 [Desulfuromonas versatilis]|uniref:Prepilin-type N-terminal cleavage/methylation domain-containing protein n=1 Tax=Desulfuromonas versatilis TaxID=2802975 RepID=A0ABM8HQY0_9BACT|nr:PilW family protein [Desulfuromonas versatilis]BCR03314.1 hypothetical protein DESUT3_03830 [Desulfuromonas versatilis]